MAAAFHAALALATVDQVRKFCVENKTKTVVFSGGVFQNELLLEAITEGLGLVPGIRLLMNQLVPANDGGICVGQAALVSASLPGSQH
jgi:hydrogenase maturation protein HypF